MSGEEESIEKKIRELEEKIKRLKNQQPKEKPGGVADSMLHGLSELMPGLGKMLEGLENSTAFQERLKEINKQIDKRIKETPFKRTRQRGRSISKRSLAGFKGNFSARTLSQSKNRSSSKAKPAKKEREVLVDIFDERGYVKVIAELPGVDEKDIKVKIQNKNLIIFANTLRQRYYKEVELPCLVKGEKKKNYNNGILEIELEKKGNHVA
jgi:HSP20 family molecular chaperone IbpA